MLQVVPETIYGTGHPGLSIPHYAQHTFLQVLAWVNQYQETLRDLGIEEDEVRFSDSSSRGEGLLLRKYVERLHSTLNTWCTNILEVMADEQVAWVCPDYLVACVPGR